jgi:hypothetical protein
MKYADGVEIQRGDRVQLFGMQTGVVVFSVDTDEYSDEFPKDEWAYLKSGVMVKTADGALVHVDDSNANEITRIP